MGAALHDVLVMCERVHDSSHAVDLGDLSRCRAAASIMISSVISACDVRGGAALPLVDAFAFV